MDGHSLRVALKDLIREVLAENQSRNQSYAPIQGIVSGVNPDGTLSVATSSGVLQSVGTPTTVVAGTQVVVLRTPEGVTIAL